MKIPIQSRSPDVPEGMGACCGKLTHPFIVRLILRQAQDAVPFMVSLSNHHDVVPSF
ncbi:MAG: hypothetical protein HY607_05650 [Planctomycetes bacterium]|nr:hypothetical protein [Planctomycetota bacterium]MBI4222149.1 hypothetical protein [Planctomycetota bacterium]